MTCRYSSADWRDVLYTCVRTTEGGVADAARFLTERRGISIHMEALRKKLRGLPGESLDLDLALMLSEWMQTKAKGAAHSHDWLATVNAQEGMCVDHVPPLEDADLECDAKALQAKFLTLATRTGEIAAVTAQTTADSRIDQGEADQLIPLLRETRVLLHRMEQRIMRALAKGAK